MAADATWFPLFEFQDYTYESFLLIPTREESGGPGATATSMKRWAGGDLMLGQAMLSGESYTVGGQLTFAPGVELAVTARGVLGRENEPACFEATGSGTDGRTKGAEYHLSGWVFSEPAAPGAGRVTAIYGAVRAVKGPDARPGLELGGMPLGTTGSFVIRRKS